jgi:hypothetical protein
MVRVRQLNQRTGETKVHGNPATFFRGRDMDRTLCRGRSFWYKYRTCSIAQRRRGGKIKKVAAGVGHHESRTPNFREFRHGQGPLHSEK